MIEDIMKKELGIDGVFASTSLSSGEDWRWQTHLLNVPLYYEYQNKDKHATLELLDAKEIAFNYSNNYRNIFDLYTNNSLTDKKLLGSKSVADSMAEFALGKAAMVQNGNWAWSQISDVKGNTVKAEDIKMLPIYTGVKGEEKQGIAIGTENYFAINKNVSEEKRKASLSFLDWLFSSETGKKYVTEKLGFITPFNTFKDDEKPNDPLAREISRYLEDGDKEIIPWIFTGFPSENFKKETGNALLEYVQGAKKWEEVRDIVINKWKSERK
jgi:raffinose/stachyose/melibiose transport system substrate-binding protein